MNPQFNPYSQNQFYMQNQGMMQNIPSVLPQQQVTQVNGKASVDAIRMSPNSSILLMDNTAPLVYLCVSDGLGKIRYGEVDAFTVVLRHLRYVSAFLVLTTILMVSII